jgi:hypothetical protein
LCKRHVNIMKLNKESMTANLDYPFKTSNKRIDPFSPSPKKKKKTRR